ncbi:hypothetical protein SAMN03080594_10343 [Arenibacter palladensis]|uniref:Uncharacterized protein n=1 Tax=Arenibacter palladensis TaxID=237373 RepID=A0A1M5A121_9FLAO|nr:hypothetical protein [Arenibacter palladensis]SHF23931.1 hypothetical protein SAMN03080594_10343 [Arenibacter palladensis]
MLGLVHGMVSKYSADTNMVFELEQQDNQDGSESDLDEEVMDFSFPNKQSLPTNLCSNNRFEIRTSSSMEIQIIGISQPTPPPEHIG